MRQLVIVGLVGVGLGCGSRAASTSDAQAVVDTGAHRDRPAKDGRTALDATTATCASLGMVGQVGLEQADTTKSGPQIAFDGERFAVVWHSQAAIISSTSGELRFALVDAAGKASTPSGISLGLDDGSLEPSLAVSPGEYAVVHDQQTSGLPPQVLRRFDGNGKTIAMAFLTTSTLRMSALAPHPSGYVALLDVGSSPELVVVDRSGSVAKPTGLITTQIMASLWLAPRPSGFAAALHSTNSNATLYVLDPTLNILKQTGVGHGASITSPSFAVTPSGFAAVYVAYGNQVESEVYDASGERLGHQPLSPAGTPSTATYQTALVWSGKQLFAVYPGAVGGQYVVQVLDGNGMPTSKSVQLPTCLTTAHGVSAAWGGNQLAVAAINEASGVMASSVCVTLMGCL
jgi:hypothetical protein